MTEHLSTRHPGDPVTHLARVMQSAGWEIEYADLDLIGDNQRVEIRIMRTDGRWLLARVDHAGRASITRYHRSVSLGKRPGRVPLSPQIDDQFLGRSKHEGARSMLRSLTTYIAENSIRQVAIADIRAGWAAVMSEPVLTGSSPEPLVHEWSPDHDQHRT